MWFILGLLVALGALMTNAFAMQSYGGRLDSAVLFGLMTAAGGFMAGLGWVALRRQGVDS